MTGRHRDARPSPPSLPHPTGGSGALARELARLYPGSDVTVFDTPEVIAAAQAPPFQSPEIEPGVRFLGGGRGPGVARAGPCGPAPAVGNPALPPQATSSAPACQPPTCTSWRGSCTTGRTRPARGRWGGSARQAGQVGHRAPRGRVSVPCRPCRSQGSDEVTGCHWVMSHVGVTRGHDSHSGLHGSQQSLMGSPGHTASWE